MIVGLAAAAIVYHWCWTNTILIIYSVIKSMTQSLIFNVIKKIRKILHDSRVRVCDVDLYTHAHTPDEKSSFLFKHSHFIKRAYDKFHFVQNAMLEELILAIFVYPLSAFRSQFMQITYKQCKFIHSIDAFIQQISDRLIACAMVCCTKNSLKLC